MPFWPKIPLTKVIVAEKNNGKTSSISSSNNSRQTSCREGGRWRAGSDREAER